MLDSPEAKKGGKEVTLSPMTPNLDMTLDFGETPKAPEIDIKKLSPPKVVEPVKIEEASKPKIGSLANRNPFGAKEEPVKEEDKPKIGSLANRNPFGTKNEETTP
jgi:hypothetical protein